MVCGGLTKSTWVCGVLFMLASQSRALKGFISPPFPGNTAGAVKSREQGGMEVGSSLSRWQINEILWNKY